MASRSRHATSSGDSVPSVKRPKAPRSERDKPAATAPTAVVPDRIAYLTVPAPRLPEWTRSPAGHWLRDGKPVPRTTPPQRRREEQYLARSIELHIAVAQQRGLTLDAVKRVVEGCVDKLRLAEWEPQRVARERSR